MKLKSGHLELRFSVDKVLCAYWLFLLHPKENGSKLFNQLFQLNINFQLYLINSYQLVLLDIFTHRLTPYAYTLHWLYWCSVLCICGQLFNFYQANLYADMFFICFSALWKGCIYRMFCCCSSLNLMWIKSDDNKTANDMFLGIKNISATILCALSY